MHDARDIARLLIGIGFDPTSPEDSVLLCPMRLQKLLYYAQGWSHAILSRPLFAQPIEAWKHGPVVRDVYELFKGQSGGIEPRLAGQLSRSIPRTVQELVSMVWGEFSRFSPSQLIRMTHSESPWRETRGNLPEDAQSDRVITEELIRNYFIDEFRRKGIDLEAVRDSWTLIGDEKEARTVSLKEARRARELLEAQ